jgi:hypothetical protein
VAETEQQTLKPTPAYASARKMVLLRQTSPIFSELDNADDCGQTVGVPDSRARIG